MNIIQAYKKGITRAIRMPKLWFILFGFNLLFALCISWPLKNLLVKTVGKSTMLNKSIGDFDFPFLSDFINKYGDHFSSFLSHSMLFILVYFLFSLFMLGGILEIIVKRKSRFAGRHFWGGSGHYFWRMVRLFIYFSLIHLFVLFIFWILFARQGLNPLKMENDTILILRLQWMIPLFAFIHMMVSMFHDFAKIKMVNDDLSIITTPVLKSFKWVVSNFTQCIGIFFINILVSAILYLVYYNLKKMIPIDTNAGIILGFLMIQMFILFRLILKLVYFGSLYEIYGVKQEQL